MTRFRLASFAILLVALGGLGWFMTAKPIQLTREFQIAVAASTPSVAWADLEPNTMGNALAAGVIRRLDDVSFWNTVTAITAAFLMFRAWLRAERHPAAMTEKCSVGRFLVTGVSVAVVLSALYLVAVYVNQGTFFYGRRNPGSADATVKTLQFMEGIVNLLVICSASFLLPLGLHLVCVIEVGLGTATGADSPDDCEDLRRSAAALAGVIFAPLCSVLLAFAGWKIIRAYAPIDPSVLGKGSPWWAVVLFCTALCAQFGFLGWRAHKRIGQYLKVRVDVLKTVWIVVIGALTSVGGLVLYLVVDATWRAESPCSGQ